MEQNERPTYNQQPRRRSVNERNPQARSQQQRRVQTGQQRPVQRQSSTGQQRRVAQTGSQRPVQSQGYSGQQQRTQTGSQRPVMQQQRAQTGSQRPIQQGHTGAQRPVQQCSRTGQQRRVAPRQQTGEIRGAQRYSRDAYAHQRKSVYARNVPRSAIYSGPTGRGTKSGKSLPIWLIGAVAAVFLVIVVVVIANPFGQGDANTTQQKAATGGGANKTAAASYLPTPIMAESAGLQLHSAVAMNELTEVLIHNASYAYANEITTQLQEATNTELIAKHGTGRVPSTQPTGNQWMTGEFIRCYRDGNAGPTMSAIDCGGPVGATVYAPVSGTVVLAKDYELYDMYDDIQVHIQPDGRSDLDVVLIHLQNVTVKNGDRVEAGVTPIGQIRDVFQYIGDSMQLKQYTAVTDNGNHTHIQVNNANDPEYHGLDDIKPAPAPAADSAAAA